MIKISIDYTKIPKDKLSKGKYLNAVLFENRHGRDEFGNDGFVAVDVTKEERERGERGPIIGNWKHLGGKPSEKPVTRKPSPEVEQPATPPPTRERDPDDDIPF